MKLEDLNPRITDSNVLIFDCPCLQCGGRVRVPLKPTRNHRGESWDHSGKLPNLTLVPSVDAGCWHGYVSNGIITGVPSKI
jgi:hypothetical protein